MNRRTNLNGTERRSVYATGSIRLPEFLVGCPGKGYALSLPRQKTHREKCNLKYKRQLPSTSATLVPSRSEYAFERRDCRGHSRGHR
jgi:hypothetical protein